MSSADELYHSKRKDDNLINPVHPSERIHDTPRGVETETLKEILQERGSRYGDFLTHAEISQGLKAVYEYNTKLKPLHKEALDMIMHKIARILNGDPNYADSWIDIAGYAQLVVDRLPK